MDKKRAFILLVEVCKLMVDNDYILSKIALQQLLYILQEVYSVDSGYEFRFYTYGPYSTELIADLDDLLSRNILSLEYCSGPDYYGSKLLPGENYKEDFINNEGFLEENKEKIEKVVQLFGRYKARELELRGALIFLGLRSGIKRKDLITAIKETKPYFKEKEIQAALFDLDKIPEIRERIKE